MIKKIFTTTALTLGLCASVHADYDFSKSNPRTDTIGGQTADKAVVTDADLTKAINDKIGSGVFSRGYDRVKVQVNNGRVSLTGQVKDNSDKEKVEKEVRNIDGVKELNSQISVDNANAKDVKNAFPQDKFASPADEQLNKKIRDNVSTGWLWNSYKEVALNTTNGVVTLEGQVGSLSDQQKLIDEIQKIDGVKSVSSNLNIKK